MRIRERLARALHPEIFTHVEKREKEIEDMVNQRVAAFIMQMDPFEPLMREFSGIFSSEYTRPEERLNAQGQFHMKALGYQLRDDQSFQHLINWIIDTQGNAAIKKGNPTPETILFSRAMIAAPLLVKKEVERLAKLYEELLADPTAGFDPTKTVE